MASTPSALPIRLVTGVLCCAACQNGYTSVLHVARLVKPHVFNMAVPECLLYSSSRMRVSSKSCSTANAIKPRPRFISKGPPISNPSRWILLSIGILAAIYDGQFYGPPPKFEPTEPAENPIILACK